jgi:hypothetical protein
LQEGIVLTYASDYSAALPKFEKALNLYRKLNIKVKIAWAVYGLAHSRRIAPLYKTMDYYTEA